MHALIYAIVYAHDEEEALEKAKNIFGSLVERHVFDYFVTFNVTVLSPKDRWGDIPAVMNALHPDAMKRISDAMDITWKEFKNNITVVRKLLDTYTDEEIFEENTKEEKIGKEELAIDPIYIARHYFDCIARSEGPGIYLYDNDGAGITSRRVLKYVMNKWYDREYKDLDIWLVPADVHF